MGINHGFYQYLQNSAAISTYSVHIVGTILSCPGMEYMVKFNLQKHLEQFHTVEERNSNPGDIIKVSQTFFSLYLYYCEQNNDIFSVLIGCKVFYLTFFPSLNLRISAYHLWGPSPCCTKSCAYVVACKQ